MPKASIDTANAQLVSYVANGDLVVLHPPRRLTKAQALVFAAWLVVMAGDDADEFARVLAAVRNT